MREERDHGGDGPGAGRGACMDAGARLSGTAPSSSFLLAAADATSARSTATVLAEAAMETGGRTRRGTSEAEAAGGLEEARVKSRRRVEEEGWLGGDLLGVEVGVASGEEDAGGVHGARERLDLGAGACGTGLSAGGAGAAGSGRGRREGARGEEQSGRWRGAALREAGEAAAPPACWGPASGGASPRCPSRLER